MLSLVALMTCCIVTGCKKEQPVQTEEKEAVETIAGFISSDIDKEKLYITKEEIE